LFGKKMKLKKSFNYFEKNFVMENLKF